MKALAARTRDIDDLRLLADTIEVDSAETAMQICSESSPTRISHPVSRDSPGTLWLKEDLIAEICSNRSACR
jgi:hypothetical protein